MENVQIQCVDKTHRQDPHERIAAVGGVYHGTRWKLALDRAIAGALNGTWQFFTSVNGRTAWVQVAYHNGHPYLRSIPDGYPYDNLLALSSCPI